MMRRMKMLLGLSAWASACVVGPRYTPPHVTLPTSWQEAPAAVPSALDRTALEQWWTAFHDPELDQLVARAIEGNLDLKIGAARIREARAARGIAASAALPQIDVTGQYARTERSNAIPPFNVPGVSSVFGPRSQNLFAVGFDAGWELDLFGGVRHDVDAAIAQVQATEESERDLLVTLLADVARNYAELRGAQQQLEILGRTLESQRDTRNLARARFDAGLGTALDVERAEGLLDTTSSQMPELQQTVRQAIYRIGVLLGQQPTALTSELEPAAPLPSQPPEVPSLLPSELLARRPDLRRAEREVAAATARVGVARSDLFPRFSITGAFGRLSQDASDLRSSTSQFWSIVPGVRWPILSGGRIRANIQVQDARQEEAVHQFEQDVLRAVEEVETAWLAHTQELHRLDTLRASVAANRRALDLATERYTGGVENFLSVLDAQRALYAAEDDQARSETNTVVTLIAIYKALGGGWAASEPPPLNAGAQP
jgi:NodT family efflux transporter outer membrane factor (OMF) lipoprotein